MTHQARNHPPTHFSLLILHIRKTTPCPTALSRPHPHFPHLTHQALNRPPTHFSLLILHIRCGIALRKSNAWSEPIIELGVPLCFCHRGAIIPVAVRRMGVFAHGLGKICNRCAEWAFLRTELEIFAVGAQERRFCARNNRWLHGRSPAAPTRLFPEGN